METQRDMLYVAFVEMTMATDPGRAQTRMIREVLRIEENMCLRNMVETMGTHDNEVHEIWNWGLVPIKFH